MEIQSIGGLPAHPLIVHMPVVLVPLAAIGAVLMAIRPSWRRALGIPTAAIATVAAIATQLAIGSGEALEESVPRSDLIETHSQIAEQARPFVFLFALVLIAVAALDWYARRQDTSSTPTAPGPDDASGAGDVQVVTRQRQAARPRTATAAIVLSVLSVLLGIGATVQVYRTGHSGAKATWDDATEQTDSTGWLKPGGGEGGGGEGGGAVTTVPERGESGEAGESGGG